MPAKSPEEICSLFRQYMAMGDIDSILDIIYDPDVVFLNQAGEAKRGREALRQEIAPFTAVKAIFDFNIKQVIQAGDIALMHTEWKVSFPHHQQISMYAIEVARRQSDDTWRWLIGDPFTVGRKNAGS
jgi:ketosteroid isomerase-like protein